MNYNKNNNKIMNYKIITIIQRNFFFFFFLWHAKINLRYGFQHVTLKGSLSRPTARSVVDALLIRIRARIDLKRVSNMSLILSYKRYVKLIIKLVSEKGDCV